MNAHPVITRDDLLSAVVYQPETGHFVRAKDWASGRGGCLLKAKAGDKCGSLHPNGYVMVFVAGKLWPAHRLAFLFINGVFPIGEVDHINGNKADNRWTNLRAVSKAENGHNRRAANKNNQGCHLGVSRISSNGKYRARICVDGKSINLGRFSNPEDAFEAYLVGKKRYHPSAPLIWPDLKQPKRQTAKVA